MLENETDFSSDLEWMLQSGQASREMLLSALNEHYYPALFRLSLAVLNDANAARVATRQILASALLHLHRYPRAGGTQAWLYRLAVEVLNKTRRQPISLPDDNRPADVFPEPKSPAEASLWQAVDEIPTEQRWVVLLHDLLEVPPDSIGRALGLAPGQVKQHLQAARQTCMTRIHLPELGLAELETVSGDSLRARWPAETLASTQLEAWHQSVYQEISRQEVQRRKFLLLREVSLIGMVVLLIASLVWGANFYLDTRPAPASTMQTISTGGLPSNPQTLQRIPEANRPEQATLDVPQPTQVQPAPQQPALTERSTAQEIRERLEASEGLWRTAWIDLEVLQFGGPAWDGPPYVARYQAWISLPDQSLELYGPASGTPRSVYLVNQGRAYFLSPDTPQAGLDPDIPEGPAGLLVFPSLRQALLPGTWIELVRQGSLVPAGQERVAGHNTVLADWFQPDGIRRLTLWVEARTGTVLRYRRYNSGGQFIVEEAIAQAVTFDSDFPAGLFDPRRPSPLQFAQEAGQDLASTQILTTPSWYPAPAATPDPHEQPERPAPGFDPAYSRLSFQSLTLPVIYTDTLTVRLLSDGYWMGNTQIGLPWSLRCLRSPDGKRLAYVSPWDGAVRPGGRLRWFNLSSPGEVYQPFEDLRISAFAFAPDSRRLAVFGTLGSSAGLYTLDIGSGQRELLLPLRQAGSLLWSPDGLSLALIGQEADQAPVAMLINVNTHQVIYRSPALQNGNLPPADAPFYAWGLPFPVELKDLEACSAPPI